MVSPDRSAARFFETGSLLHLACLLACSLIVGIFCVAEKRALCRGDGTALHRLRRIAGFGCLAVWLVNTAFWCLPGQFSWRSSLPLHVCNLANLVGAMAVLGRRRFWQSVLYFWSLTLCIWAFLTPVLGGGYATVEFWIFWGYHLFIPVALAEVLVAQRFRPRLTDLRNAWWFTIAYLTLVAIADRLFGWNYGFVGPSAPASPTLIDVLGPYPLRLLWMVLIGTALFILAWLPWRKCG